MIIHRAVSSRFVAWRSFSECVRRYRRRTGLRQSSLVSVMTAVVVYGAIYLVPSNLSAQQTPAVLPAAVPAPDRGAPPPQSPATEDIGSELSLGDAIRAALENNRNVSISRRRIGIAEDRLRMAKAGDWPTVTFDGSTAQRDTRPLVIIGGQVIPQGDKYTAATHTALVLPITDFGRTLNAKESAEAGVDVARLNSERTEQDIVLQVSQAYYRVLQAQKIRQVVLDSIASVQLQLRDAKAFFEQGLVSNSDVLSAEVRLAERQQDLITAEANQQIAMATLNRVMGADLDKKAHLKDVAGEPQWNGNYESLLQIAHQSRSDLRAALMQMRSSEADLAAARADNFPRLSAYASYDTNTTSIFKYNEWTTTGLALSMTIFSGGAQTATIERKKKELLEAQDQYLERQDNISLDVKQAFLTVGQTFDSLRVARQNQQLAGENLRILRDRYTQGLVTSTDVLVAEDASSRAKSNYYQALYDYYSALARLENIVGQSKS